MDVEDVIPANGRPHLAYGFEEGLAFDVAYGSADLDEDDIRRLVARSAEHEVLDDVGNVGTVWMVPPRWSPRRSSAMRRV